MVYQIGGEKCFNTALICYKIHKFTIGFMDNTNNSTCSHQGNQRFGLSVTVHRVG